MLLTYANTGRVNQEVSRLGHMLHTFGALGPPVRAPILPSTCKSAPFEASVFLWSTQWFLGLPSSLGPVKSRVRKGNERKPPSQTLHSSRSPGATCVVSRGLPASPFLFSVAFIFQGHFLHFQPRLPFTDSTFPFHTLSIFPLWFCTHFILYLLHRQSFTLKVLVTIQPLLV